MRFCTRFLALIMSACPSLAAGNITVEMKVIEPSATQGPYRSAELHLRSQLDQPIAAMEVRAADGGPRLLFPLTVAPRGQGRLRISLPADGLAQTFVVRAFDRYANASDGLAVKQLAQAEAMVEWPPGERKDDTTLNPQLYAAFQTVKPDWPTEFRRQLLLVLAGVCVLTGFVLVVRGPLPRAALAVATALGSTVLIAWMLLRAGPPPSQVNTYQLLERRADGSVASRTLFLATGRRTTQGPLAPGLPRDGKVWPVYPSLASRRADNTLLRPMEPAFSGGLPVEYAIEPWQIKLFEARQELPPSMIKGLSVPPPVIGHLGEDMLTVRPAEGSTPPSILIVGNRFFVVDAMAAGADRELAADSSILLDNLWAQPQGVAFDDDTRRLLTGWLNTTDRETKGFLVYPHRQDGVPQLHVSAVTVARAPATRQSPAAP